MSVASKDRIFQTADEMDTRGQKPTLAAVRKALGGGSYTSISESMGEWKARKSAKENTLLREPAPQAVVERLGDMGSEIWALALELADGRLTAEREALQAARVDLEAGKAEVTELADQLSVELETLKKRIVDLEATEKTARDDDSKLREKIIALTTCSVTAEARAVEIEKRADDLNAELARVNQQNSELIKVLSEEVPERRGQHFLVEEVEVRP